jgi:hypothetical protein
MHRGAGVLLYADFGSFWWQGHIIVLFFVFWGTSILISKAVSLVYFPINSVQGSLFPHIFTSICHCLLPWWWPFWRWDGRFQCLLIHISFTALAYLSELEFSILWSKQVELDGNFLSHVSELYLNYYFYGFSVPGHLCLFLRPNVLWWNSCFS